MQQRDRCASYSHPRPRVAPKTLPIGCRKARNWWRPCLLEPGAELEVDYRHALDSRWAAYGAYDSAGSVPLLFL